MKKIMSPRCLSVLPLLAAFTVFLAGCQSRDERLVEAVYRDEPDAVINDLLVKGAKPDALVAPAWGPSALHAAVRKRNIEMAQRLIAAGASVDAGKAGYKEPDRAIRYGDGPWITATCYDQPLHIAVSNGDQSMVRLLLDSGASIEAAGGYGFETRPDGRTPLYIAAGQGDTAMIRLLLSCGAKLDGANAYGTTAIESAAESGKLKAVRLLLQTANEGRDKRLKLAFIASAQSKNPELVKYLLAEGASVQSVGVYGRTALHLASMYGDVSSVGVLLAAGADPNAEDHSGETVPCYAVEGTENAGKIAVLRTLLSHGADVKKPNQHGTTPLHIAAFGSNAECIRILMDAGADVTARTQVSFNGSPRGLTALGLADYLGKKEAAQAIREKLAVRK